MIYIGQKTWSKGWWQKKKCKQLRREFFRVSEKRSVGMEGSFKQRALSKS